jgi:geranylgeranylglycerol-phosphate geranylgeranyltransferase
LIGVVVSLFIGKSAVILYLIFWIIGFLYNWKLKEFGLLGNLSVSSSVAITIILGAIVVGDPWNKAVIIFTLLVFTLNLGEEIAADAMDMEGDKQRNIKSIAILYGRKKALQISAFLFIIAIILSLLPFLWGLFGIIYLIIVLLMDILILFFTIKLIKSKSKMRGNMLIRRIYLSGLFGMVLIILRMIIF